MHLAITMDIFPIEVRMDSSSCKLDLNENEFWYELDHPEEVGIASPVKKLLEQVSEVLNVTKSKLLFIKERSGRSRLCSLPW